MPSLIVPGPSPFYHTKTPIDFYEYALTLPHFEANQKRIPMTFQVMRQIAKYNRLSVSGMSSIRRSFFSDKLGSSYSKDLSALIEGGLLASDGTYRKKGTMGPGDLGKCISYGITPLGYQKIAEKNMIYLKFTREDPKERKKLMQRILDRGYKKIEYTYPFLNHLKRINDGTDWNENEMHAYGSTLSEDQYCHLSECLRSIRDKDYDELHFNESDGRAWYPVVNLPGASKSMITVEGLPYLCDIDIRSAHPTFLLGSIRRNSNNKPLPISIPHLVYGKPVIISPEEEENRVWNDFWCGDIDPKDRLSKELDIPRHAVKEVLLSFVNGKGFENNKFVLTSPNHPAVKINNWMKSIIPIHYQIWMESPDIAQTGNLIGKYFESPLMQEMKIYKKAFELDLFPVYSYDGITLYGTAIENVPKLIEFIQGISIEMHQIRPVLTIKNLKEKKVSTPKDIRSQVQEAIAKEKQLTKEIQGLSFRRKEGSASQGESFTLRINQKVQERGDILTQLFKSPFREEMEAIQKEEREQSNREKRQARMIERVVSTDEVF